MRAPASIGQRLEDVDTPALIVELDAFEKNLATLGETLKGRNVRARPHAKTHKCPEIAKRQIAAGAVGVCCQKVSEAEAMVEGGIGDVLVSNEVVGAQKLVPDLDAAFRRIDDYVFPYEDARLREQIGIGTAITRTLIVERDFMPGRTTVILVRQPIGV